MAKRKQPEHEENLSIGSQMKSGSSSRERNLALKAKMVKDGTHPEPTFAPGTTQEERNLQLKAKLYGKAEK